MSHRRRTASWLLIACLVISSLNCGLTELMWATPTPSAGEDTTVSTGTTTPAPPTTTKTTEPTTTLTPQPSQLTTETGTPEPPALPTETNTPVPLPPPANTDTPVPTKTPPELRIEFFDIELEDAAGGGKTIRCTWETSGAGKVRIVLGTRQRFPIWQDGDPDGTTIFQAIETYYPNPNVTLTASGVTGGEVVEFVTLDWPCAHTYFFTSDITDPNICPAAPALTVQGAQQPFQGGTMLWVPGIEGDDWIYVLTNDGGWQRYVDTWHEGLPENDPTIVPPSGFVQPIRGFGKIWRDHPEVQNSLNWGVTGESAVAITHQRQMQESIGGVQYIQPAGAQVIALYGIGGSGSTWRSSKP